MSWATFSPAAIADIDSIWDYTEGKWGPDQADNYIDDIRDACSALAEGLKKGRAVDVREGYLKYAVRKHLVFFKMAGGGITVIRVLHQKMDPSLHL